MKEVAQRGSDETGVTLSAPGSPNRQGGRVWQSNPPARIVDATTGGATAKARASTLMYFGA
jgi:hypothetical protein